MADADQPVSEGLKGAGDCMDIPLSDGPLLDLLDALVNDRGRVAAAEALGVNYRTMVASYESRRLSRRMRRALEEYRDAGVDGDEHDAAEGDGMVEGKSESLDRRVEVLEEESQTLREAVEAQAEQLAQLERRVGAPEEGERQRRKVDAVCDGDDRLREWRPPGREYGLPDAGVVTLEEQPDEKHAFGPAAPLVAEWRELRTGGEAYGSRVDRVGASVRRWELETAMLGDFGLTLSPETEPLDASRREDHLRWRQEALAAAQRRLSKAKLVRWLRRIITVGIWWR